MAYVPGQKLGEDDEQQGAPVVGGAAAPALGGVQGAGVSAVGSSPVSQSNASQGGAGTGFVNIDKYLVANKGAGLDVQQRGQAALDSDKSAFDKKAGSTMSEINKQRQGLADPDKLVSNVTGATSTDMRDAAVTAAQNAINKKFTGPTTVDFDIGNTVLAKRAAALGNAATAGKQIAADTGTLGQYGTGLSAIDRAIYGSAQENPALAQVAQNAGAQVQNQQLRKQGVEGFARGTEKLIGDNAQSVRDAFGKAAKGIQDAAGVKAKEAADTLAKIKGGLAPTAEGRATWEDGSGAPTAGNFLSSGDVDALHAIGRVTGDAGLLGAQSSGPYVQGHWNYHNDAPQTFGENTGPANVADVSTRTPYVPSTKEVADATRGMTPEQKNNYAYIHQANPLLTPAQIAEDVRSGGTANQDKYGGHKPKYSNIR